MKGSWLLTSAKRITKHTTTTWGDSVNYFWYPQVNYPIKYYRSKVYDTINVGTTEWTITSDKIYQGQSQFYYDRKNANSAYCDQIQIDFYDTYMIVNLDSNKMVLETNSQVDILSGFFLFEHFSVLEFQKISNAAIQNKHYFNKSLDYCLSMNDYDSISISGLDHVVQPYDPYQLYNNTNPVKGLSLIHI